MFYTYHRDTFFKISELFKAKPMSGSTDKRLNILCPVELTLSLLSNKWKALVMRDLLDGRKRFSQLQKSVTGISQKVLTANLRSMEQDGLLTREVFPEVPPRVEYELTELGYSLKGIIDAMAQWGNYYRAYRAGRTAG